jgi:hypothetical protein
MSYAGRRCVRFQRGNGHETHVSGKSRYFVSASHDW